MVLNVKSENRICMQKPTLNLTNCNTTPTITTAYDFRYNYSYIHIFLFEFPELATNHWSKVPEPMHDYQLVQTSERKF